MEQKILDLLNEIYPVDLMKVELVTNEMFRCTAKDDVYFARITNYKNFDEQLEEVNYTTFLYKQGLGVSPTIASLNGKIVEKIILNNNEVLTILYKSAPGMHLPRNRWDVDLLKELGRQIGDLHQKMLEQLPLFIKLKEVFEYSLMHMYWDKEKLTENQIRIMNHFRMRIEHNHTLLNI